MNAKLNSVPVAVAITVRILAGATEDLTLPHLRRGQRQWWIQRTDRAPGSGAVPWLDAGSQRGDGPAEFTVDLAPGGRYVVGTGSSTRVRFVCPQVPCTMAVDPGQGTANVVGSGPALTVVGQDDGPSGRPCCHVRNAPEGSEPRLRTYDSFADAGAALGRAIQAGTIPALDVATGKVVVTAGPWPVASYPPPPPVQPAPSVLGDGFSLKIGEFWFSLNPTSAIHADQIAQRRADEHGVPVTLHYPEGDDVVYQPKAGTEYTQSTVTPLAEALPPVRTPTIPPAPVRVVSAPAPVIPVARPVAPDVVTPASSAPSARTVDEIQGDNARLAGLGFAPPPRGISLGFDAYGYQVRDGVSSLDRRVRGSRASWERQPRVMDALADIQRQVQSEQRVDVPIGRACDVRMLADGRVTHPSWDGAFRLEQGVLRDLVSEHRSVLPRSAELLAVLPPATRAVVWNEQVPKSLATRASVLRTRVPDEQGRSVYASVSPGYTALDVDQLSGVIGDALARMPDGDTCRGTAHYSPDTTTFTVDGSFHTDVVSNTAVGDVFKLGFRARTNDAGGGAIRFDPYVLRGTCHNGMVAVVGGSGVRLVHRGSRDQLVAEVTRAIRKVTDAAAPFVARWETCRATPASVLVRNPSADPVVNIRAILRELVIPDTDSVEEQARRAGPAVVRDQDMPVLDAAGMERDILVATLLRAFDEEPGETLADVVNAITRLHAHRVPVPVLASAEVVAGQLVHAWGRESWA